MRVRPNCKRIRGGNEWTNDAGYTMGYSGRYEERPGASLAQKIKGAERWGIRRRGREKMPSCPCGASQDRRHWDTRGTECVRMLSCGDYREHAFPWPCSSLF